MNKNRTFSHLVTCFFNAHLAAEQGLSANTIASYSDCMCLLIQYTCERFDIHTEKLGMELFTVDLVVDFLDHLEKNRENSEATRNLRLATIKTFFHFLSRNVPELMHVNECIQAIRPKVTDHLPPPSLTVAEVNAIIDAPDSQTLIGSRDKALIQIMYNTGARVQEIADLRLADLRFDTPITVTLTGKGRKRRTIPLWPATVRTIQHYLQSRESAEIQSDHLFLNVANRPMTRFGIGRRIELHVQTAAEGCPTLHDRRISPHVFRHTTALHLIEAGNDITIVKEWLGHVDLKTTSRYIEVSVQRKQAALEKFPSPGSSEKAETPAWKSPPLMDFLSRLSRKKR